MSKLPPYLMDAEGYCYSTTYELALFPALTPWYGEADASGQAVLGSEPSPPWTGQTVVCVASGPSLTQEDCDAVKDTGLTTLVANDSWRRAEFAQVLFASDHGWWQQHTHEITVPAERWTDSVPAAQEFGLHLYVTPRRPSSSGGRLIELAADLGAKRVLMIGYDCSLKAGSHWHGDHTRTGNPTEQTIGRWHSQFAAIAASLAAQGVEVLNCSRETALTCFARQPLEEALDSVKKMEASLVP